MRKLAAVSAVATAHPIKPRKPLENFLFGLSCPGGGVPGWLGRLFNQSICVLGNVVSNCPGGGSVRVARETVYKAGVPAQHD